MAQGDIQGGVVTCPWHGWAFRCDNGLSADDNGCALKTYPVKVENGRVLVALGGSGGNGAAAAKTDDQGVALRVVEVVQETHDVRTIRLDNSERLVGLHQPGQHIKVCVTGPSGSTWRSFTVSSAPTRPDLLELTVKRNPNGIVSPAIHSLKASDVLTIKGPQGKFVFEPQQHTEPLVLAVAGSGVTPAMSILRTIHDRQLDLPVSLFYGSRTRADIIFARELEELRLRLANFRMILTLSRPDPSWTGEVGRVDASLLARHLREPAHFRYFLCGPGNFTSSLTSWLLDQGVARDRIHSEQFGKSWRSPDTTLAHACESSAPSIYAMS
jgi:ferredoxin-NADP reductase